MSLVTVVGSATADLVMRAERFPMPGETLLGGEFSVFPGGKGANQAVAAAKAGARVRFVGAVGVDAYGDRVLETLEANGVDCSGLVRNPDSFTATATILIDANGENCIVVASGANALLDPEHVRRCLGSERKGDGGLVLAQLENNLESVYACKESGNRLILNPAPAAELPDDLLDGVYAVVPNQVELRMLTGVDVSDADGIERACQMLLEKGVEHVVATLGARGCAAYARDGWMKYVPSFPVTPLDTVAAGDALCGSLAAALSKGLGWDDALRFANAAAAVSVTKRGAMDSIPNLDEIESMLSS